MENVISEDLIEGTDYDGHPETTKVVVYKAMEPSVHWVVEVISDGHSIEYDEFDTQKDAIECKVQAIHDLRVTYRTRERDRARGRRAHVINRLNEFVDDFGGDEGIAVSALIGLIKTSKIKEAIERLTDRRRKV